MHTHAHTHARTRTHTNTLSHADMVLRMVHKSMPQSRRRRTLFLLGRIPAGLPPHATPKQTHSLKLKRGAHPCTPGAPELSGTHTHTYTHTHCNRDTLQLRHTRTHTATETHTHTHSRVCTLNRTRARTRATTHAAALELQAGEPCEAREGKQARP